MNLCGNTRVLVVSAGRASKLTRVCSRHFNRALKDGVLFQVVEPESGAALVPSKGNWAQAAIAVRAGKKFVVKVDAPRVRKSKKSAEATV
jgi:hypothetical protein